MSHAVNGELEHAEPACLDTGSWRCSEGAGSAPGQRRWEHPAAEGLAKPPLPCPVLLLPPPCSHQLWAAGAAGGILHPFDGTLPPLVDSLGLFGAAQAAPPLTPGECPASITRCRSSTDFPRPFAPEEKKFTFVMASILPLPPHPCLENSAHFLQLGMYFSSSP